MYRANKKLLNRCQKLIPHLSLLVCFYLKVHDWWYLDSIAVKEVRVA